MKQKPRERIINNHNPNKIIDTLKPYLSDNRQQRIEQTINQRLSSIHLALENPYDIRNALAVIRSCESFGVINLHIISPEADAINSDGVSQGAAQWIYIHFHSSLKQFLIYINEQQLQLVGGVINTNKKIEEVPVEKPLCILLGNEHRGLSQHAQDHCNTLFKIPMVGMTESLNLSVCAALSLYDTSNRRRTKINSMGDLTNNQQHILRSHYYLNSVKGKIIDNLLSP